MSLDDLIEAMEKIDKAQDFSAMDAAAELLMLKYIPLTKKVEVTRIIDKTVDSFAEVRKAVPNFNFSFWAGGTILETVDMMITCGYLKGPIVDMNESSHELLEAEISRTDACADLIEDHEYEIECYLPAPDGRKKS